MLSCAMPNTDDEKVCGRKVAAVIPIRGTFPMVFFHREDIMYTCICDSLLQSH